MKKIKHSSTKRMTGKHIALLFLSAVCFFGYTFFILAPGQDSMGDTCKKVVELTVRGNSMSPLIEDGAKIGVIEDFYSCHNEEPKRGDVVIIEDSAINGSYIKTLGAIPGNTLQFLEDGTLLVEKNPLKNKKGDTYNFGANEQNFISLYIRDGRLQNNAYLFFGENTRSSRDSRKIGALSKDAIKAKVVSVNGIPLH